MFLLPRGMLCLGWRCSRLRKKRPGFSGFVSTKFLGAPIFQSSDMKFRAIYTLVASWNSLRNNLKSQKLMRFDNCGFVVEPEVRQVDSSSSILLSQDSFGYLRFFVFPYNLTSFKSKVSVRLSSHLKLWIVFQPHSGYWQNSASWSTGLWFAFSYWLSDRGCS